MIERVGLLNQGLEEMSPLAWDIYCNWENAGQPINVDSTVAVVSLVDDFKITFSRSDTTIHFMGLWDTVNSVGLIIDRMFPYTIRSSIVRHVRHAVSIDERRAKFKQVLFEEGYPYLTILESTSEGLICPEHSSRASSSACATSPSESTMGRFLQGMLGRRRRTRLRNMPSEDVIEMYFPGNHGDCGGGWTPDKDGQSLSDIALRWILLQAIIYGVVFKPGSIHDFDKRHPVRASLLSCNHDLLSLKLGATKRHKGKGWGGLIKANTGTLNLQQRAQELEIFQRSTLRILPVGQSEPQDLPTEAVSRFDSRGNEFWGYALCWWIIELFPLGFKIENRFGEWKRVYSPNFGRHRKIGKSSVFHWSVFWRIHYCQDYRPPNLPRGSISEKFLELIRDFDLEFHGVDLVKFSKNLDIKQIGNFDLYSQSVWGIIPDELKSYLIENQNL